SRYSAPRVVASDAVTEYSVAALTRHDVVAALNHHTSPSDSEAVIRMCAVQDILSPAVGPRRTAMLLSRYEVDLVLLNQTFHEPMIDYMAFLDPSEYPRVRNKFESHPEVFREVFEAPGQRVYEVIHPN